MKVIKVNNEIRILQELRLIQFLNESDFKISIPSSEYYKVEPIAKKFKEVYLQDYSTGLDFAGITNIDHAEPKTEILGIKRPLFFPKCIIDYLKNNWKEKRNYHYSFQGLITDNRKILLDNWLSNKDVRVLNSGSLNLILSSIFSKKEKFLLKSTKRGRNFPEKSWDEDYYKEMLDSKFVLCPEGDFIWSYRFFEAILCGAIPIVNKTCEIYKGFKFKMFSDDQSDYLWNFEDAFHNYELCLERITVSQTELNMELNKCFKLVEDS